MTHNDYLYAHRAYLALLDIPHGSLRTELQPALALLRDRLAETRGLDPETLQNQYEAFISDCKGH